jgi:hypothetical protein
MKNILRFFLAVLVGLLVGGVVNMALVITGPHVFPPPPGVDVADPKSLAAGIHLLEPKHFLFPFLAHALGTLVGALVGHLIASTQRGVVAAVIGVMFLIGGISAVYMIPAPAWFGALDLIVAYLPMAWLGARIGSRVRP